MSQGFVIILAPEESKASIFKDIECPSVSNKQSIVWLSE